jgi:PleD family two-component response regulator
MPKKILLVDDSSIMLLLERMVLASGGYQLLAARDGEEAVRTALTDVPDLILLDVLMPRMDGFEVCRTLRSHDRTRRTPIIMVTTRGDEANVEEGFRSGCNDFVVKPINGLELLTKIKNLLGE